MKFIASFFILFISIMSIKFLGLSLSNNRRLLDKPNDRTMHENPTMRGAGVVFIGLWLLILPVLAAITQENLTNQLLFILLVFSLALLSFLDDLLNLSVKLRLAVQFIVSLMAAFYLTPIHLDFLIVNLTDPSVVLFVIVFGCLWAINHFNFMDGLDGFAALQAIFLLSCYSLIFYYNHAYFYSNSCLFLLAAVLGFLFFNFPPAKIFMGDVGSASLGFISFMMALIAQKYCHVSLAYWFMLNGIFLFDSTITLIRRIVNRENWSQPHKKHAYQRLKQLGVNSITILLGQLTVNLLIASLVLMMSFHQEYALYFVLVELVLVSLIYLVIESCCPMPTNHPELSV